MGTSNFNRRERRVAIVMTLAGLWSVALIAASFFVRAYQSSGATFGTYTTSPPPGATLIQENGDKVLIPLSVPLVIVLIVAALMLRRQRRGQVLVGPAAWTGAVLMGILSFLGLFTIGPFILPVTVLLLVACVMATPSKAESIRRSAP
ncbi:MAG TPA: hypothetical protein VII67_02540 [Acidimicrobiales bacterium]